MTHKPKITENPDPGIRNLPEEFPSHETRQKSQQAEKTHNGQTDWKSLQAAISEKDILSLREQLKDVLAENINIKKHRLPDFDLTDPTNAETVPDEWKDDDPDFLYADKPLPKIHIHHHRRALDERTHHFYTEQVKTEIGELEDMEEHEDDHHWLFLEEAMKENDVIGLREYLHQIALSVSHHDYSKEDIEKYLDGKMSVTDLDEFNAEMSINPELARDIALHTELKKAVLETDIIELRDKLRNVIQHQHSTSRSIEEIEAFLEGEFSLQDKDAFIQELTDNSDLRSEVNLVKDMNKAFSEKDISGLRNLLNHIALQSKHTGLYSVLPVQSKKITHGRIYAAVLFFLVGLSSLIWHVNNSERSGYDRYFAPPEAISTFRSAGTLVYGDMDKGFQFYNQGQFSSALNCFIRVLQTNEKDPVAHFFAGASFQSLHQYQKALDHYQEVINHRDNPFLEQAEWLTALCYLGHSDKKLASLKLEAIIQKNGYYKKDASLLLSEIEKSLH
jgi:tetratricopeptide (TPR) repeat protein